MYWNFVKCINLPQPEERTAPAVATAMTAARMIKVFMVNKVGWLVWKTERFF